MSSVDFYKKARGGKDLFFLDFLLLFYQEKSIVWFRRNN